jgi:DNA-binding IclR family transcriptional regulator
MTSTRTFERELSGDHALETRIRAEFREMCGLSLTLGQAARLFGLPQERCAELFARLTDQGFLERKADARYALRDRRP